MVLRTRKVEKKRNARNLNLRRRLPHEYDEVMGITQVDPREAERFQEGLDSEYHDASEDPPVPERPEPTHMPCFPTGVVAVHHYVNAKNC